MSLEIRCKNSLLNCSAVDGRYSVATLGLNEYFSEYALHKARVHVEIQHFIMLSTHMNLFTLSYEDIEWLEAICENFHLEHAHNIVEYEKFQRNNIGPLQHDVKAVEISIVEILNKSHLKHLVPFLHFGLTSEDVSNVACAINLQDFVKFYFLPKVHDMAKLIRDLADKYKSCAILSMTHGQPASPTTFGKEMAVFLDRLSEEINELVNFKISAKLNGAVGNYSALVQAYPDKDWIQYSKDFINKVGQQHMKCSLLTDQRGPKGSWIGLFQIMIRVLNIIRDLNVDMWLYLSRKILRQLSNRGEVGSSTMPHKTNPWRCESSEGNCKIAIALFELFCRELDVSRMQRDLSDHALERNFGDAFGSTMVAIQYTTKFLKNLVLAEEFSISELIKNPEVLSEAYQTILRKHSISDAFFLFKDKFKGQKLTIDEIHKIILDLPLEGNIRKELLAVDVKQYIGLSQKLTEIAIAEFNEINIEKE